MSVSLAAFSSAQALADALPRAGTFARATWVTNPKPSKAHHGTLLTKTTTGVVRFGVAYANLQANAETVCPCGHVFQGRDTGQLPWGHWLVYPLVIGHKNALYVRLYAPLQGLTSTYAVDGVTVDRAAFNEYLTPSAAKPKPVAPLAPCPACGRQRQQSLTLTPRADTVTVG
jgi:hypothetical protein